MCWSSPTRDAENSCTAVFSSFGLILASFGRLTPGHLRDKDPRHFSRDEERRRAGSTGSRCLLSENGRGGSHIIPSHPSPGGGCGLGATDQAALLQRVRVSQPRFFVMAKVQVLNVAVLDNPSPFGNPFQFEITFECMEDLPEDLEWKIIYVGSAESEEYDQTLDSVLVGPVPAGRHMFVFQADAPNTGLIPESDAVGVTVVLITCTYRGQEFIRIGYYVNNEYTDPELRENPPIKPAYSQLQRNILASNPRVTRFHINWEMSTDKMEDSENVDPAPNTMLPPTCLPGKAPPLGLMPDNSMDCL
ncbi:hypothetical protein MHYP_G00100630 [Metynnis hypsauchen]